MISKAVKFVRGGSVHKRFEDSPTALLLLTELDEMCTRVRDHMWNKYIVQTELPPDLPKSAVGLTKSSVLKQIETDNSASEYPPRHEFGRRVMIARLLKSRYRPGELIENHPSGTTNTSYVMNKGTIMSICLREKQSGQNNLHSRDILRFVTLHELSHIGTMLTGHETGFWKNFKVILQEAAEIGFPTPCFSASDPQPYCGISVTYNPMYSALPLHVINKYDI